MGRIGAPPSVLLSRESFSETANSRFRSVKNPGLQHPVITVSKYCTISSFHRGSVDQGYHAHAHVNGGTVTVFHGPNGNTLACCIHL